MITELTNFLLFAEKGINYIPISIDSFLAQMYILEEELSHKIVTRVSKGDLKLTSFGEKFIPFAKKSLNALEESFNIAHEASVYDFDNYLTLSIATDSASTWGINCIKNFNKMHPGLRLTILARDILTERMLKNSTIIFWCIDKDIPGYDKLWYVEYEYGLYASEIYIKQYGEPTLDNIKQHKVIALSGRVNYSGKDEYNYKGTNWHLFGEHGLPKLTPNIWLQSRDLIAKYTSEGKGIGAICSRQDIYYGYKPAKRVIKIINGPVFRSYFMVKNSLNEQMMCNVDLLSKLFKRYFEERNVSIFYV